jgi:hypothetical protein
MPAAPPRRSIRLVRPPDVRGIGAFAITIDGQTQHYTFREIPCEIGGRGFAIHRTGVGARYDVRIGRPEQTSCECLGFLRHGRCKHVLGLRALIKQGESKISPTSSTATPAA